MNQQESLNRRDLLKRASAFAIPAIIPEGVIGRPGSPGANDRIVYAHIGVGGMGSSHIVSDAAALCDVDANHLAAAAKIVKGSPMLVSDYRRILDRKDIDAVTIGTPDHWHALMTVHACQAGKDVYSEKPTCRTIQEGRAMVNAARRYNRVVQIGAQGRSNPMARDACRYLRNHQIGSIKHVEVWHVNNFTGGWGEEREVPPELDWNMWLGPARWRPYNPDICHFNFRWMMDFGGGFIRDRGNHVLSIVMWCMGADQTGPVSVEATGYPTRDGIWDVPVTMEVTWEFQNPDWKLTWSQPGARYSFPGSNQPIDWGAKYHGEKGSLIVSGGDGGCDTEPKAKEFKTPAGGFEPFLDPDPAEDPTERHRQNWRKCIRSRQRPVMDVEIGYRVITLPIIANISYQLGRKLSWDAKNERFLGDEEANRLLAQPYRHPWAL